MEALATLLSRERTLLELLVFKLVEMRQLMLAGETRFLDWAAEEVERATAAVRLTEVERAVLVDSLAEARGLTDPSLSELVADCPAPWQSVLEDDVRGLRALAAEASELLQSNRRLAAAGARSLAESLGTVAPAGATPYSTAAPAPRVQHVL